MRTKIYLSKEVVVWTSLVSTLSSISSLQACDLHKPQSSIIIDLIISFFLSSLWNNSYELLGKDNYRSELSLHEFNINTYMFFVHARIIPHLEFYEWIWCFRLQNFIIYIYIYIYIFRLFTHIFISHSYCKICLLSSLLSSLKWFTNLASTSKIYVSYSYYNLT